MHWCCELLKSVAKSKVEFYFVQTLHTTQKLRDNPCYTVQISGNFLATASRDKLLRKLRSVTGPQTEGLSTLVYITVQKQYDKNSSLRLKFLL